MPILAGALFTKAIGYILNRTGGQILNRNSQPIVTRGSATGGGGGGGTSDTGTTSTNLTFTDVVNGGSVYDSSNVGHKISINRKVTVNGTEDSSTSNVEEVLIFSSTIYYRNSFGTWFSKSSSGTWSTASGDPRMSSGSIKQRSARTIIDGLGFNIGPLGSGSGPTTAQIATALQFVGARWIRIPYKGGSVIGSGSSSPPASDISQILSQMQSNSYTNPNIKVQFYADAQSTNGTADLWTATQGPYVISSVASIRDGNGNTVLHAVEGPTKMDTVTSVTVDTTTTYSNSTASTVNSARLGWQQTISSWRSTNASSLPGVRLVAPTYTNSTWYKLAGTGGTSTLDSNLNTTSYEDYAGYQLYMTNTLSASTGTTWTGQGMPCGSGNRGIDTAFDHGLQYMAAGTALAGSPNATLVQVEVDAPISGGSLSGYGTDGKSAAKANLCWFMDFMLLGGKRLFFFQLLGDSGNNSGAYGWYATDFSTARPSATCMHNLINLLSLNKSFSNNPADTSAITPKFDISKLTVGSPSSPSTAGTSVATNFTSANVVHPGVLVVPKSDGTTLIIIWNEPSIQNSYGTSGELTPSAEAVTVSLGTGWNYNLYDISGSGGSQTMTPATSTTAYQSGTAGSFSVNLYGLPVVIELTSTVSASASGTTVSDTSGSIIDSVWETFTLSSGGQVVVNGVTDSTTGSVILILYYNGKVYQENSSGGWWSKTTASDTWQSEANGDPRSGGTSGGVQAQSSDGFVEILGTNIGINNSITTAQMNALSNVFKDIGLRHIRCGLFFGQLNTNTKGTAMPNGVRIYSGLLSTVNNNTWVNEAITQETNFPGSLFALEGPNEPEITTQLGTDTASRVTKAISDETAQWNLAKANSKTSSLPIYSMPSAQGGPGGYVHNYISGGLKASGDVTTGYYSAIASHNAYQAQQPESTQSSQDGTKTWMQASSDVDVKGVLQAAVSNNTATTTLEGYVGGKLPVAYSEGGINGSGGSGQGNIYNEHIWYIRQALWFYSTGTTKFYHFCLYQLGAAPAGFGWIQGDPEGSTLPAPPFALATSNSGNPAQAKPGYFACKNIIALLTDPPSAAGVDSFVPGKLTYSLSSSGNTITGPTGWPKITGSTMYIHHVLLGKRDGSFIIALWQYQTTTSRTVMTSGPTASPSPLSSGKSVTITTSGMTTYKTVVMDNWATATQKTWPSSGTTISNNQVTVNAFDYVTFVMLIP